MVVFGRRTLLFMDFTSTLDHAPGLRGPTPLLRLQGDDRLIALTRRGNQSAYEALVARYQSRLLAFCRHMLSSREDAEDVLQEVFAAAYNAMLADDRPINARPWLYRIARNRCLNHLRRQQAIGVDSMDVHLAEHGQTTADKVHKREEFRQLVADVQDLPETQRTALLLREIDALSYDQIAEAMETTIPSVKSLLVRARVSLAEAAEARLLTCEEARDELAEVAEGLKRSTPPVRRHVRQCDSCSAFKKHLRQTDRALAAVFPVGPLLLLKKFLITQGAAGTGAAGAAAGGAAVAGGAAGSAAAGSALSAGITAIGTKAAAGLTAAAIVAAGAVEVDHHRRTKVQRAPAVAAIVAPPAAAAAVASAPPVVVASTPQEEAVTAVSATGGAVAGDPDLRAGAAKRDAADDPAVPVPVPAATPAPAAPLVPGAVPAIPEIADGVLPTQEGSDTVRLPGAPLPQGSGGVAGPDEPTPAPTPAGTPAPAPVAQPGPAPAPEPPPAAAEPAPAPAETAPAPAPETAPAPEPQPDPGPAPAASAPEPRPEPAPAPPVDVPAVADLPPAG